MASSSTTTNLYPSPLSLALDHPSLPHLLATYPSALPQAQLGKFASRVNAALLGRMGSSSEVRGALQAAMALLGRSEDEGLILEGWGKGWFGHCVASLGSPQLPPQAVQTHLALVLAILRASPQYPSFEREAVLPLLSKLAVTLSKLLERSLSSPADWAVLDDLLSGTLQILTHSPASFRPLLPTLRQSLMPLLLSYPTLMAPPPQPIKQAAASLLAALHLCAGKAQSPAAWREEMLGAIGGVHLAISAICTDAWMEESRIVSPPNPPAGLPALPAAASERLPAALDWLEGFLELALALLRFPTTRPVPVPLGLLMTATLRCLNITLETPIVAHILPQHHAALVACLPRIWSAGSLLLAGTAIACGDGVLPFLTDIFDHTVFLLEHLPSSMSQSQAQLLHLHYLLLTLYPPAVVPVDYPTRLLKYCLAQIGSVLEQPSSSTPSAPASAPGGKRGKKRARGAEDGLVGGLEGRQSRRIERHQVEVVLAALKLTPLLHPTPLLTPSLLTLSIRVHLSLHLSLTTLPQHAFSDPSDLAKLAEASEVVLEQALYMIEGEQGTQRGWKAAILIVLPTRGERTSLLLHPSVPPLIRPTPPIESLHFFKEEGEEERRLRGEIGLGRVDDVSAEEENEAGEDGEEVAKAKEREAGIVAASGSGADGVGRGHTTPAPVIPVVASIRATETISEPSSKRHLTTTTPIESLHPAPAAVPALSAVLTTDTQTEAFIEVSTSASKTSTVTALQEVQRDDGEGGAEDSDGPIPELDSGSDDDEEEEEDDEEMDE